jgi:protein tyrosine phosphatase
VYSTKELTNIRKSLKYWNISDEQKKCVVNLINDVELSLSRDNQETDIEILTSEQVKVLDEEVTKQGKAVIMAIHSANPQGWKDDCQCLNNLSVYKMAKSLFNGYKTDV